MICDTTKWKIMEILYKTPKPREDDYVASRLLTMAGVSEHTRISQTCVSSNFRALEKSGLIEKMGRYHVDGKHMGRVFCYRLTEFGNRVYKGEPENPRHEYGVKYRIKGGTKLDNYLEIIKQLPHSKIDGMNVTVAGPDMAMAAALQRLGLLKEAKA